MGYWAGGQHWPLATGWVGGTGYWVLGGRAGLGTRWVGGIPRRGDGGLLWLGLHCHQCQYQWLVISALYPVLRLNYAIRNSYLSGGMAMKDEQLTNCTRRTMATDSAIAVA